MNKWRFISIVKIINTSDIIFNILIKFFKKSQFIITKHNIDIISDISSNIIINAPIIVNDIESSLIKEMNGCKIKDAWKAEAEDRTCSACDFRTFCNKKKGQESENKQVFTIP